MELSEVEEAIERDKREYELDQAKVSVNRPAIEVLEGIYGMIRIEREVQMSCK
jgi:hypothetical protein